MTIRASRLAIVSLFIVLASLITPASFAGQGDGKTTAGTSSSFWHTVHYANWEHGDLPPSKIPWQSITHLIHFAGNTLGAQTNGTYPYWQAPSNWEIDNSYPAYAHIGDTLRAYGAKYGVIIEIDAGFNPSNQFYSLCSKGDTAIATWAGQIGHYMVNWNYGGVDFDLEGGTYPPNYGFQKMVKFLRDTLASIAPGKKFYFTASVMPNSGDQTGWGIVGGPNPAINLMDQINPMFYDVSGTFGSPLYKNPNCSTWGSDSGVTASLLGVGIPAAKLGMGYNIQVYHTASTTACPPGGFGYISKFKSEIQYFPPASGATLYWDDVTKEPYMINTTAGVKVGYEDTLSTYYKADFIKRKGLGGAMGFCLGRGYLPSPPNGWLPHMAVQGMGRALLNGVIITPPVDSVKPTVALLSPATGDTLTGIVTLSAQASDNVGVSKVEFLLNGAVLGTAYSAPYTYSWNTLNVTGSEVVAARASDAAGNVATSASATVVVVPPPPVPPVAPVLASPANGSANQGVTLSLTWNASATATRYHLQVSAVSNFGSTIVDDTTLTGTSRSVGALAYSTNYYWRVGASNSYGAGSYSTSWSFTTQAPPTPDTIPHTAVLRDDFNGTDGPIVGRAKWSPITNSYADGQLTIFDSAAQAMSDSGLHNFGGNVWDTLMSAGTEASVRITQKSGDMAYSSCFLYAKMNGKDYNTATGYRLKYMEQSGADLIEIHRVGPGYINSTVLASVNREINPGDQLTFRVLTDNKTLVGLVNGVPVVTAVDSAYMPGSWYFAVRTCVFTTPFRVDNFSVSSTPVVASVLTAPQLQSPANKAVLSTNAVTLTWNAVSGGTTYHLRVAGDSLFTAVVLDDSAVSGTSRSLSGLAAGANFFWKVCAQNGTSSGPYSTTQSFSTPAPPPPVVLSASTNLLNFGSVAIGKIKNDSLILTNHGSKVLSIVQIQSTVAQFLVSPSSFNLPVNGSSKVYVTFSPLQKTNYNGLVITLSDSTGITDTVSVVGKGVNPPRNSRNRTSITFGTVTPGVMAIDSFTVTNTGDLSLSLTQVQSTSTDFSVQPSSATIAPSDSQKFYVSTTSAATAVTSAYIVFDGNGSPAIDSMLVQITSVSGVNDKTVPSVFALSQNFPNPFNPTTAISYALPERSRVILQIYNTLGELVATPVNDVQESGDRTVTWDATSDRGLNVPSGVYFYRLTTISVSQRATLFVETKKMMLLK